MNAKKTNWLFTSIILLNVVVVAAVEFVTGYMVIEIGTIPGLLLSQAICLCRRFCFYLPHGPK